MATTRDPSRSEELDTTLYRAADTLRIVAALVDPVMPEAAGRLRHRHSWTVAHLVERLTDHAARLTELASGEQSVSAAFHVAYGQLDEAHRRMFRLLGVHPAGPVDRSVRRHGSPLGFDRHGTGGYLPDCMAAQVRPPTMPSEVRP